MIDHESILRKKREIEQRIRELDRVIGKVKDPISLKIELKDGSQLVLSIREFGRSCLDHMLHKMLADLKKEDQSLADRISKWE